MNTNNFPLVLVTLTEKATTCCSIICFHLFHKLKTKFPNEKTASNVLDLEFFEVQANLLIYVPSENITLINPIQISPTCNCTDNQNEITFQIVCPLNTWSFQNPSDSIHVNPHTFLVSFENLIISYAKEIAKSVTIQLDMNTNAKVIDQMKMQLHHRYIPCHSYHYDENLRQNIHITEIETKTGIKKTTTNFPELYFIDEFTCFLCKENDQHTRQISSNHKNNNNLSNQNVISTDYDDINKLRDYINICIQWPNYFPNSLFSPPCGILLKTLSTNEVTR